MGPRDKLIQLIKADQDLFNRLAQATRQTSLKQSALNVAMLITHNSAQLIELINTLDIDQVNELLLIARQTNIRA